LLPQGSSLIAGGAFEYAGSTIARGVAIQQNGSWQQMGDGLASDDGTSANVRSLTSHQGSIYAGGNFTRSGATTGLSNLARWNGSAWTSVAGGTQGSVFTMLSDAATGALIAGGSFTRAGGVDAQRVARLVNGSWQAMGAGFSNGANAASVFAFAFYNNELYAGGNFTASGSTSILALAKWNGAAWVPVVNNSGVGLWSGTTQAQVYALTVHNGELIIGGTFVAAGGEPNTAALAKFNGTRFAAVGLPLETDIQFARVSVTALRSTPDGLIVAGNFTNCAGLPALNIAKHFNGAWSALGLGVEALPPLGAVRTLASVGSDILVGGDIRSAGGVASAGVARWALQGGNTGPVFATTPGAPTRNCGSNVTLNATLTRNDVGLSVRWRKNGVVVQPGTQPSGSVITGADSLSITISNARPADSGEWVCEASNPCGTAFSTGAALTITPCVPTGPQCDSIDFNNDGFFPTEQDITDYIRVLMGAPCPDGRTCNDIDFNNDGLFPDDRDLITFIRVFAGGSCE
jgi:hypothetical protein